MYFAFAMIDGVIEVFLTRFEWIFCDAFSAKSGNDLKFRATSEESMKKEYYVDLGLLIILMITTLFTITQIDNNSYIIMFIVFLVLSAYVNFKFRIVLKYPYEGKFSYFEKMTFLLMELGKISYFISITDIVYVNPNLDDHDFTVYGKLAFILYLLLFKATSYVSDDKLIYHFSKMVDIKDIKDYELREKSFNIYYLSLHLENDNVLKLRLSDYNYQKLQKFQFGIE
ncbi:hypothetical protein [Acetobacterium sp. K1/6]|uniref:hypothetical protein n=2 Tax=unclassified Acetobacterium TaxID=2638182 RepID=UPI000DBEB47B|nr:hypothetical protein [Acetobacterium sp. K1/6]AWW28007.1 hypothetical protein DOZ58_15935 [Acetobacterium sp. KB-1]MDZ5726863.1 hypothetical protein [Acetobacterium sp. K1/6]